MKLEKRDDGRYEFQLWPDHMIMVLTQNEVNELAQLTNQAGREERNELTDLLEDEIGGMPSDRPATNTEIIAAVHLLKQQLDVALEQIQERVSHADMLWRTLTECADLLGCPEDGSQIIPRLKQLIATEEFPKSQLASFVVPLSPPTAHSPHCCCAMCQ